MAGAQEFCSLAFRRETAQELLETGPHWPAISAVGVWDSADFAGYADLTPEVEDGVRRMYLNAVDGEYTWGEEFRIPRT